jgi:hypothetical protein
MHGKGEGKGNPITVHQGPRGAVELYSFLTSALEGGGWSSPRPGRVTPGKDPVPIVQEAGWATGPVWTCMKNLAPTGIRSPDRPACSQSLYGLSYLAPLMQGTNIKLQLTERRQSSCITPDGSARGSSEEKDKLEIGSCQGPD